MGREETSFVRISGSRQLQMSTPVQSTRSLTVFCFSDRHTYLAMMSSTVHHDQERGLALCHSVSSPMELVTCFSSERYATATAVTFDKGRAPFTIDEESFDSNLAISCRRGFLTLVDQAEVFLAFPAGVILLLDPAPVRGMRLRRAGCPLQVRKYLMRGNSTSGPRSLEEPQLEHRVGIDRPKMKSPIMLELPPI